MDAGRLGIKVGNSETYILADIGGTHLRYACLNGEGITLPTKVQLSEYKNLVTCFESIIESEGIKGDVALVMAVTDAADLTPFEHSSLKIKMQVNDFEASARGAVTLTHDQTISLHEGAKNKGYNRLICGPGTGLGLAYMLPVDGKRFKVLRTFGGHFIATSQTDEQHMIVDLVRRVQGQEEVVSFEGIVSGRGLPNLYKAICMLHGHLPETVECTKILDNANSFIGKETLRLFHEFFGLFVNTAAITGHAFGGVYLDGGVIQAIHERGLFDKTSFFTMMQLNANKKIVAKALEETPVRLIDTSFVAIQGLRALLEDQGAV